MTCNDVGDRIAAVCVGTPHASLAELERLRELLAGGAPLVPLWVNTGRDVLERVEGAGVSEELGASGVRIVTDTRTYLTPLIGDVDGSMMTDHRPLSHRGARALGGASMPVVVASEVRVATGTRLRIDATAERARVEPA